MHRACACPGNSETVVEKLTNETAATAHVPFPDALEQFTYETAVY